MLPFLCKPQRRRIDVDKWNGDVDKSRFGKLILNFIPTKEIEEMVVSYLARRVKNVPEKILARMVRKTPFVLSRNIAAARGQRIAQNLRDLGAKAEFVSHDPEPRGPQGLSYETSTPDIETIQLMSEQYKAPQNNQPKSSRAGKKLMTAIVVAILIAVFSLLIWQLHHLLTANIFQ
jgi:hypothetical protein